MPSSPAATPAAADWRGGRWFAPLRPLIDAIGAPGDDPAHAAPAQSGGPPDWLAALNRLAAQRGLLSGGGVPLRFVEPGTHADLLSYEQRIGQQGLVSTRTSGDGAWHDWFNGLAWLAYPAIKARLNALACQALQRDGGGPVRGNLRDASTVFDENGVLFVTSDAALVQALRRHDWTSLFVTDRGRWAGQARVLLFGHALMHKLCRPYKAICAHAWVVTPDAGQLARIDAGDWSAIDGLVAPLLQEASLRTRELLPLPVLGVPGWWPANDTPAFYNDAQVFRANRRERDTP